MVMRLAGRLGAVGASAGPGLDDVHPLVGRFEVGEVVVGLRAAAEVGEVVGVGVALDLEGVAVGAAAAAGVEGGAREAVEEAHDLVAQVAVGGPVGEGHAVGAPLEVAPGADLAGHDAGRRASAEPGQPAHAHLVEVAARLPEVRPLVRGHEHAAVVVGRQAVVGGPAGVVPEHLEADAAAPGRRPCRGRRAARRTAPAGSARSRTTARPTSGARSSRCSCSPTGNDTASRRTRTTMSSRVPAKTPTVTAGSSIVWPGASETAARSGTAADRTIGPASARSTDRLQLPRYSSAMNQPSSGSPPRWRAVQGMKA